MIKKSVTEEKKVLPSQRNQVKLEKVNKPLQYILTDDITFEQFNLCRSKNSQR